MALPALPAGTCAIYSRARSLTHWPFRAGIFYKTELPPHQPQQQLRKFATASTSVNFPHGSQSKQLATQISISTLTSRRVSALCRETALARSRPKTATIFRSTVTAPRPRRLYSSLANMATTTWTGPKVRETFLEFFRERGHTIVPSSSVVPHNDPTLLFTNAGMNQFKPIFLGTISQTDDMAKMKRAVDTQKCIRAGGKHNDLDDVGKDSYHHTFFEMLGNWSFGDYFKKEAIEWSWELLTKVYGLDPDRLYVTYFEGNPAMSLEPDLEAKELWRSVGVPDDHILPGNMKDNFWEMGDQGPCGPCSEIHYDKIGGRNVAHLVNNDDPMVVEIWNNVFIQFDRQKDKSLKTLPAQHVDTGMGFERLVSALQHKKSNYATDIFTSIFDRIQEVTGARSYTDNYGKDDVDGVDTAYRVVADHIRLLSFSIADGAVPNNDGRGYVVRRVLRRGVRYARKYFKAEIGSFFSKILPALVAQMGDQFPELRKKEADIKEILDEEEEAFSRTLDRGEKQFERYAASATKNNETKLSGADVWRLYDTFGFPEDLTKIMAEERGLGWDDEEIAVAREKAREASKSVKEAVQTFSKLTVHQLAELEGELNIPRPNDDAKFVKGDSTATVQLMYDGTKFVKSTADIAAGTPLGLLLDKTNFYAESGGQVADTGRIIVDDVVEFKVLDVQAYGGYIVHNGYVEYGTLSSGQQVICEYDELRRQPIRANHTGTHVLNHSLREVLGDEVHQKGSLVDSDKLRFDFSHKTGVTTAELRKIEDMSNAYIRQNCKVYARDVDLELARAIAGVRAVFGETYPNPVRVVSVGIPVELLLEKPGEAEWRRVSVEFCGGTHVENTGLIKDLVVVEESGIAKGIRRIVALTADAARAAQRDSAAFSERLDALAALPVGGPEKEQELKAATLALAELVAPAVDKEEFRNRLGVIAKEITEDQKKRSKAEGKAALDVVMAAFADKAKTFHVARLPLQSANARVVGEVLNYFKAKDKAKSVYVFAAGDSGEGGVAHGVYVGTDLASKGVKAEDWSAEVSKLVGGKAGGKDPTRQGLGTAGEKVDEAVDVAEKWLREKLKL